MDVEVVKLISCAIQQTPLCRYCCHIGVGYSEVCIVTIHQSLISNHEILQRALMWISEWQACAEANLVTSWPFLDHSAHYAAQYLPDAFGNLFWEALCEHEKPDEWGNRVNGANKIQWSYSKVQGGA